ncbi:hypothetical protein C8R42DRAFT_648328 [Lentinula raphanica]|nr:hypothetical protein C8R42DRAFT_648328 [Lentinula raphanica]
MSVTSSSANRTSLQNSTADATVIKIRTRMVSMGTSVWTQTIYLEIPRRDTGFLPKYFSTTLIVNPRIEIIWNIQEQTLFSLLAPSVLLFPQASSMTFQFTALIFVLSWTVEGHNRVPIDCHPSLDAYVVQAKTVKGALYVERNGILGSGAKYEAREQTKSVELGLTQSGVVKLSWTFTARSPGWTSEICERSENYSSTWQILDVSYSAPFCNVLQPAECKLANT